MSAWRAGAWAVCGRPDASAAARLADWPTGMGLVAAGWQPLLQSFMQSGAGQGVTRALQAELAAGRAVYPCQPLRALQLTAPEDVRVVILGQDPYHGAGQANGLAFAVDAGVRPPPSLRNIGRELQRDFGLAAGQMPPLDGLLQGWAAQGVLLLNTVLTVREGQAASHAGMGWQALTTAVLAHLAAQDRPMVFMLWGGHAQGVCERIAPAGRQRCHLRLLANHPSPLSALRQPRPFVGSGHFRQANAWLAQMGVAPVEWLPGQARKAF